MKKRQKKKTGIPRFLAVTAAVMLLPFAVRGIAGGTEKIARWSGGAAVISAAATMPDAGIALLRERFQSELYEPEQGHTSQEPAPAAPQTETPQDEAQADPFVPPAQSQPQLQTPGAAAVPPKIPDKYAAALISENFSGKDNGVLLKYGGGFIKNDTNQSDAAVAEILETPFGPGFSASGGPQVLIVHTHATESFERFDTMVYDTRNTWRSTDNNLNMAAVGAAMERVLTENGVGVIHDTTQHDYPSYNGSYERSAETVEAYLEQYPSIKVVLDLHRDAMEREDQAIVKPVAMIDGVKTAQLMIIAGCDDGSMNMPDWRKNLRFAAAFQDRMEQMYPGLTRPILLCHRKYNMDLSGGYLLLEFGSNGNTLEEAVYSGQLLGNILVKVLSDLQ